MRSPDFVLLNEAAFDNRVKEFYVCLDKELTDCQDQVFLVLPWSHYHQLQASPAARVFLLEKDAEAYADDCRDELVALPLFDAAHAAAAFDILCAVDWSPNQSPDERGANSAIHDECLATIQFYMHHAAPPHSEDTPG